MCVLLHFQPLLLFYVLHDFVDTLLFFLSLALFVQLLLLLFCLPHIVPIDFGTLKQQAGTENCYVHVFFNCAPSTAANDVVAALFVVLTLGGKSCEALGLEVESNCPLCSVISCGRLQSLVCMPYLVD